MGLSCGADKAQCFIPLRRAKRVRVGNPAPHIQHSAILPILYFAFSSVPVSGIMKSMV
jgi:hypothetical protein